MALEARVPVIPCAMIDTDKIQPIGKKIPRLRRPGVRIGRPLDFSRYEGLAGDRFVERSMTDEIMYELMMLSGREYVDLYAAKVKADKSRGGGPGEPGAVRPEVREAGDRTPAQRAG
jgi:1-acyl-sn-glycerol-3-phosphate acyltransferase